MRELREFGLEYLDEYIEIAYNSYPSFKDYSNEGKADFKRLILIRMNDHKSKFYGMFEGETLIAAMRLFDFEMNYFNKMVPASGLASVAVHLMYKKEKIAKVMVDFYEDLYRKKEVCFALLLPFTPEFYKKMGYGLGPKMNRYKIKCQRLPASYEKADIRYVETDNLEPLLACHTRFVQKTHGMIIKIDEEIVELRENKANRLVAHYNEAGLIDGYLVFEFFNGKEGNYTINNIQIKEFIYENTTAFKNLLGFLRKQDDQVNLVIFDTQDEYFAHRFDNPLNDTLNYIPFGNLETNTQGIGVMYKVLNPELAFSQHDYRNYNNISLKVKFKITDENNELIEQIVHFNSGKVTTKQSTYDVCLKLTLVDFSSLFLGSISIKGLLSLGLLEIDNLDYLEPLDLAFYCAQKPICNTDF